MDQVALSFLRWALESMDVSLALIRWRKRPAAALIVVAALLSATGFVLAAGGPPTPLTHLFYLAVIPAAVLRGPRIGLAAGAVAGVLAEPVPRVLLGQSGAIDGGWIVRAGAMMLVGWVCGSLTGSLLRRVHELETLNIETIFAFVRAIDARDPYTARHSEKVAAYAVELAQALGLEPAACERIRLAGLLHDVGKLALERSVLHKAGPLSDEEWRQVREHPGMSAHIIGGVTHFAAFLPGARHHHERYDGHGYPDGLAGTEIPLDARVLAVADAYDAMISHRSYRAALPHAQAMECLAAGAGSQFDPVCVEAFATVRLDPARIDAAMAPLLELNLLDHVA
jgi:HD-GYP domain-containing protein (c-di-GMP phosphodiesterase class II)